MPYQYSGEAAVSKIFVVICHEAGYAICLKATSQVDFYLNDPDLMAGVVYFSASTISFFPSNTAIQPDNAHPIPHSDIARSQANGTFKLLGTMPPTFKQLLTNAINASITMKPLRKQHLLQRL